MTPETLEQELEAAALFAVAEIARELADEIRNTTPVNKTRTRTGVYYLARGTQAVIGIRFAERYGGDTPTRRRLERQWQILRPLVRQKLITKINDRLKG